MNRIRPVFFGSGEDNQQVRDLFKCFAYSGSLSALAVVCFSFLFSMFVVSDWVRSSNAGGSG